MYRIAAILTTVLTLSATANAGGIDLGLGLFKKKPKPESASRAKQLVTTLQTDPDEKKRLVAAEELRGFDPRTNGDLVPALISALQKDPSPAVRSEAATSIGKLKPVYQPAGIAMETALVADPDQKVRDSVKSALWQYHLNGYRSAPAGSAQSGQTAEPPLAIGRPAPNTGMNPRTVSQPGVEPTFRPITNSVGKGVFYQPTVEPPLAKPKNQPPTPPQNVNVPAPSILPPPLPASSVPDPVAKPTAPVTSTPSTTTPPIGVPTVTVPPPLPATPSLPSIPTPPSGVPSVSVPRLPSSTGK